MRILPVDCLKCFRVARIIRSVSNNNAAVGIDTTVSQSTRCRMEATELEQLNEYIKGKRLDVVDEVCCHLGHWAVQKFVDINRWTQDTDHLLHAAVVVV